MNEVMVLLNPRMLEKETAATIQPVLNELSRDSPPKEDWVERVEEETEQTSIK